MTEIEQFHNLVKTVKISKHEVTISADVLISLDNEISDMENLFENIFEWYQECPVLLSWADDLYNLLGKELD